MPNVVIGERTYNILHTEWSSGWGGQEQRIILECRKMQQLGHNIIIACQPGSGIFGEAVRQGIPVEKVVIKGSYDIKAIHRLFRIIRKHRIDVVNTHSGKDSWVGGIAAKLAGVPLLVRTRHLSVPISNNPFNFIHRLFDGFITTGEAIRNTMISDNRIPPEKIVSISTGVDTDRFNPDFACGELKKRELGIEQNCRVVTMIAVLRSMKRHDLLIEVARQLIGEFPDVRYLVVGEGPMRNVISERLQEAQLQDLFILSGYRTDIPELLSISDIVVLTSDRFEGVPQSLSQAMAMARPVVAAPVGSIPELVINGETGLIAETGNADSFSAALRRLLDDESLRVRIGTAARKHVLDNYTADIMAEKTLTFYAALLRLKHK
jgi:glycosyltransferase involved in cell wall biosynthesis